MPTRRQVGPVRRIAGLLILVRLGEPIAMIHGSPNGLALLGWLLQRSDWTERCIAVTSVEMAEIWVAVDNGTPIEIRP